MKRLLVLLLTALLLLGCTACGSAKIEDSNGPEDSSLAVITEENILKRNLPSGGYGVRTNSNRVTCYGKGFSGVTEILSTGSSGRERVTRRKLLKPYSSSFLLSVNWP